MSTPSRASPVGDEREIERRAVPRDQDPAVELGEPAVQLGQDRGLVADHLIDDHLEAVRAAHGHGDDCAGGRVEPVDGGVGLDVEAVPGPRGWAAVADGRKRRGDALDNTHAR
jgi:hypothetical protein